MLGTMNAVEVARERAQMMERVNMMPDDEWETRSKSESSQWNALCDDCEGC